MVDEAVIGAMIDVSFHSCHEKVAGMVGQMAILPPNVVSPCLDNLPHLLEDIHTPMIFRSEEEQLVGHELI
jgi:hypothetical protein